MTGITIIMASVRRSRRNWRNSLMIIAFIGSSSAVARDL